MATDAPKQARYSECLLVSQGTYEITEDRGPWISFQIEHLLEWQLHMDRDRLKDILNNPSGVACSVVTDAYEFHDKNQRIPIDHPWNAYCDYQENLMHVSDRTDAVLLGERCNAKIASPAPHEYERIERRKSAGYKKTTFPPFLKIQQIATSAVVEREALVAYLLDYVKEQCRSGIYDFLCAEVDGGDMDVMEELEDQQFTMLTTTFPRDDALWMVWPEDWNKRWV